MVPFAAYMQAEREAWLPPERLRPGPWASKYRTLRVGRSANPGPLRHDLAPWAPGIANIVAAPGVVQGTVRKAAQMAGTEGARHYVG
jgi:phage terminase large subunit GpA-like protein